MDVTAAASIESALDAAEVRFGPIDIVVNNAGVTATRPALIKMRPIGTKLSTPT